MNVSFPQTIYGVSLCFFDGHGGTLCKAWALTVSGENPLTPDEAAARAEREYRAALASHPEYRAAIEARGFRLEHMRRGPWDVTWVVQTQGAPVAQAAGCASRARPSPSANGTNGTHQAKGPGLRERLAELVATMEVRARGLRHRQATVAIMNEANIARARAEEVEAAAALVRDIIGPRG